MLHGGIRANCHLKKKAVWFAAPLITFVCLRLPNAVGFNQEDRRRGSGRYGAKETGVSSISRFNKAACGPRYHDRKCESTEVARTDIKKRTRCSSENGANCLIGGWLKVPEGAFTPKKL